MCVKKLYDKYRDVILYLVFGVCTTAVNIAVYFGMAHLFRYSTMVSTVTAWTAAVLFAYVTNRRWVFHSQAKSGRRVLKEAASFFAGRLATGLADWGCMFLFAEILALDDVVIKTGANILVIILNYIVSKRIVFRKKRGDEFGKVSNKRRPAGSNRSDLLRRPVD